MKNKLMLILLLQLCYTIPAAAQSFAINTDGSTANASSILDVKSTVKGVLIPRLTTTQRTSIASPVKGLLVYDSTANSFWVYDGSAWQEMVAGNNTLWKKNGNEIYNTNTGRVGIGIINPNALLHVRDGAVLFDNSTGTTPVSGAGTRLMWIPFRRAFRAGLVSGTEWDDANIGSHSVAFGYNTKANGHSSIATGSNSTASGLTSVALGLYSTASGDQSTAMGYLSTASGDQSTAMGFRSAASGDHSTATGFATRSKSYSGFTAGSYNDSSNAFNPNGFHALNRIFQIGNGTSDNNRANAMTVLHNGNIGIGELNPAFPLNFASALGNKISLWGNGSNHYGFGIQSNLLQVYTDGSGSDIGFGYGNSSSFTERVRIKGNGNVGIGESNPAFPLNFASALGDKISLWGNGSDHYGFGIQSNLLQVYTNGSGADIAFGFGNSSSFTERVRFKGNGNVGIGLNSPARMLSVATDISVDESDTNNGTIDGSLHFGGIVTGEAIGSKRTVGGNLYGLDFYTSHLNRMVITHAGRVGIGVYSPNHLLSVASDIGVDADNANNGTTAGGLHFGGPVSGQAIGSKRTAGGNQLGLDFYTNYTNRLCISNSGNVGIGETNPAFPLNFASTLGDKISLWGNGSDHYGFGIQPNLLQVYTESLWNDIGFGYGNSSSFTEHVRFKGNGNVGIGTIAPAAMLDVNGTTTTNALQVDNGTVITKMQSGTVTVGPSGSSQLVFSFNFPVAFATSTPRFFVGTRNAPSTNFPDTFSVTVRSISATGVVLNIQRTDINTNWTQIIRIDWFAVE